MGTGAIDLRVWSSLSTTKIPWDWQVALGSTLISGRCSVMDQCEWSEKKSLRWSGVPRCFSKCLAVALGAKMWYSRPEGVCRQGAAVGRLHNGILVAELDALIPTAFQTTVVHRRYRWPEPAQSVITFHEQLMGDWYTLQCQCWQSLIRDGHR
jgi:hypothetical protein